MKLSKPIIAHIGSQKYKSIIQWRNGEIIADEPLDLGGQDLGPDPFSLLLASLASCTLATLRMYIDRKGWDIPKITIVVNLNQENKIDLTTNIEREIIFDNEIDEEKKNKLLSIAEACPISKLLKNKVQISTLINKKALKPMDTIKEYTNNEATIIWQASKCKHSGNCVRNLPNVFKPKEKPWIRPENATTEEIIKTVAKCPSGALSMKE